MMVLLAAIFLPNVGTIYYLVSEFTAMDKKLSAIKSEVQSKEVKDDPSHRTDHSVRSSGLPDRGYHNNLSGREVPPGSDQHHQGVDRGAYGGLQIMHESGGYLTAMAVLGLAGGIVLLAILILCMVWMSYEVADKGRRDSGKL